jgi:ferric-dicitrate binding protein FerR (iron transport regulator)
MNEEERQRESREALERVKRDSETAGSSALARMSQRAQDHFAARDAEGASEGGSTDPIELWGRRIGRSLSVIGFVVLVLWLLVQLGIV